MCSNQLSYVARYYHILRWLGYLDSNQGMPVSKTGALPLGDTPIPSRQSANIEEIWLGYLDSNQGMPVSKTGALPLGDTPMTVAVNRYIEEKMAGVPGFEPGNAGIKNRCLTAWRYPIRATLTREWCGRRDLNSHTLRRQNLNLVRLPISPLPQKRWWLRRDSNL